MSEYVEDFVEDENSSSNDLFDCEFTSVDAVINQVTVFTGVETRQTENGERALWLPMERAMADLLSLLIVKS